MPSAWNLHKELNWSCSEPSMTGQRICMGKQKLILPFGAFSPWFAVIRCLEARLHRALQRVGGDEAPGSGRSRVLRGSCVLSASPVQPSQRLLPFPASPHWGVPPGISTLFPWRNKEKGNLIQGSGIPWNNPRIPTQTWDCIHPLGRGPTSFPGRRKQICG